MSYVTTYINVNKKTLFLADCSFVTMHAVYPGFSTRLSQLPSSSSAYTPSHAQPNAPLCGGTYPRRTDKYSDLRQLFCAPSTLNHSAARGGPPGAADTMARQSCSAAQPSRRPVPS